MTPPPAPGTSVLTFVRDGRLAELSGGGERCLHEIGPGEMGRPAWSPDGTRVLLNPSRMLDANNGVSDTGFFPENDKARWSMPTGKSIIAPAVKDGSLIKRLAGNASSRSDITFLMPTEAVAYHPAGKHIIASGFGPQGAGLYLASNLGKDPRLIAQLTDEQTHITEIVAPPAGNEVVFVHDHGSFSHVHRLSLPDLALTDLLLIDGDVSHLVVMGDGAVAVRSGSCAEPGGTVIVHLGPDTPDVDLASVMPGQSLVAVGELDGQLVVEARPQGCTGPASVALVDLGNPAAFMVAAVNVDSAAVRGTTPTVGELPGEVDAQAPG